MDTTMSQATRNLDELNRLVRMDPELLTDEELLRLAAVAEALGLAPQDHGTDS